MGWKRGEGLPVVGFADRLMAGVDDVVELAIQSNTLTPLSPYFGWTLTRFRAQRYTLPVRSVGPTRSKED
jgi:hypothetical protein